MKPQAPSFGQPAFAATPVGRAIRILELMALENGQPASVATLAEGMDLPVPAVRRALRSLADLGLIEATDDFSYSFAPRLLCLTGLVHAGVPLEKFARPVMRELVAKFDETSTLNAYLHVERRGICVAVEECQKPIQYQLEPGEVKYLHSGAAGKSILAFLPESTANEIFERHGLPAITENTTTNRAALARELDRIRKDGVAVTRGERIVGSVGVAAPVFGATGQVVASLCLTIPLLRTSDKLIESARHEVRRQAQNLSKELGFDPARSVLERPHLPRARS